MHLKHTFQMVHITFVSLAIDVCTEVQFLDLVANKLALERPASQFQAIHRFERVLESRRILFKKVTIMPEGQSPKL